MWHRSAAAVAPFLVLVGFRRSFDKPRPVCPEILDPKRESGQNDCRTEVWILGRIMALVGYARVSTQEQELSSQLDALRAVGCDPVFEDYASGARSDRPGLAQALAYLRRGDVLVVWKLDRLARSLSHLIETVYGLDTRAPSCAA
jgi:hypothetical protein